jgi:Fibronectin type III domain
MKLQYVRNALASRIKVLAAMAVVATLATGPAMADPPSLVQYLPRDGAAIVVWTAPAGTVTGYNVYQQIVDDPTKDPPASTKVNTDPIKETSFMVPGLKNGTCYHFTVTAIVDGKESDPAGPALAGSSGDSDGTHVCVVPQKPTQIAGVTGDFYGFNIGTNFPGSHSVDASGVINMKASGWDMYNQTDGFYFLATPMAGDITVTVRCVSGPTQTSDGNGWNLGGPIIRETLDSHSRFAMMQIASTSQLQFKKRQELDSTPANDGFDRDDNTARPVWLRVQRKGDLFNASWSEDGKTFTALGDPQSIDGFVKEPYVGIALCGHQDGEYSTAVFDNFKITSP